MTSHEPIDISDKPNNWGGHPVWTGVKRGVAGALTVASALAVGGSTSAAKPGGPYHPAPTSTSVYEDALSMPTSSRELRERASPVELSDTLDGKLSTDGYQIYLDYKKIREDLAANQFVVAKHHMILDEGDGHQIFTSKDLVPPSDDPLFFSRMASSSNPQAQGFAANELNEYMGAPRNPGMSPQRENKDAPAHIQTMGSGVQAHAAGPQHITFDTYEYKEDGTVVLVGAERSEIKILPNLECKGLDSKVSVEVRLTKKERKLACEVLRLYDDLLPDYSKISLDSTQSPYSSYDSFGETTRTGQLTYPIDGGEPIDGRVFASTALHEYMHAAFDNVAEGSDLSMQFEKSYEAVIASMEYAMPSWQDQFDSGLSVADVEPVWASITESFYPPEKENAGHPWDNATEMVSSTASVIQYYPDKFLQRFTNLSSRQQYAIYGAIESVGGLVDFTGSDIEETLPNYRRIQKATQEIIAQG